MFIKHYLHAAWRALASGFPIFIYLIFFANPKSSQQELPASNTNRLQHTRFLENQDLPKALSQMGLPLQRVLKAQSLTKAPHQLTFHLGRTQGGNALPGGQGRIAAWSDLQSQAKNPQGDRARKVI